MGTCDGGNSSNTFPMYLMIIEGERCFLSLQEAGKVFDNGHINVSIGNLVRESDRSVRNITPEEVTKISEVADEYSADK